MNEFNPTCCSGLKQLWMSTLNDFPKIYYMINIIKITNTLIIDIIKFYLKSSFS